MTVGERLRGSLAAKLLLIMAGASILLTILVSSIEIWQERDAAIAAEQSEARAAVMANLDTLALALWGFDERVMNVTAASLVRGTSVFHVEVIDDGKPVVTVDRPGQPLIADYTWDVPLVRPNSSERIGTLRISESYDEVRSQLERRSAILVVTELTKILATSILLFCIVYLLVARPLRLLAQKVQSAEPGEAPGPISVPRSFGDKHDEIEALIDAINASNATRQQMEAEQRRHQLREANAGKLEALGQLAGGIAHDFNNLLGAILGFAGLLKDDLSDRPEQRRFAQRILTAGERGKELIEQIRTFARAETTEHHVVDLGRIARQNMNFLSASLPKATKLVFRHTGEELPVEGSEALLGQLLANLCINASEALEGRAGDIRVTLERCGTAELEKLRTLAAASDERFIGQIDPEKSYACLRVTDTAGGIPESILDRMFDPFFTTKGRQRGTGLGLSVVHGVVESHAGACHVVSRLGEGTTFSIYLPLETSPLTVPLRSPPAASVRGGERILIVDDEPDIVDTLSIGLERLGYETAGVTNALEALEALQEDPKAWDIVVTDDVMTGLRGLDLIRRLKAIRPDIKTVLCTGYSDATADEVTRAAGVDIFLLKPVDAASIAMKLRELMDIAPAK